MSKYSAEDKLRMVKLILEAKHSITSISASKGIHPTTLEEWIRNYQSMGSEAFYNKGWTKRTSAEKEIAVQEYLSGLGSLRDICKKHKISSTHTLRQWIALYNGHKELKASGTGGVTALQDNRGKRKPEDSLTEMEKLQAELKMEKAKRQRAEMELSFLKKLEEIERRRG